MQDPYQLLGVEKTASAEEIRKAYLRLAKELHPDLNPGKKEAEEHFKQVSGAYDLLSDKEKRGRFDRGEIDSSGSERPRQKYYKDFAAGAEGRPYEDNSGYADFSADNDLFAEIFRRQRQGGRHARGDDVEYALSLEFLDAVNGTAQHIVLPDGTSLNVKIPRGIAEGQVLRLKGKGAPSLAEGQPGDALVAISIKPHRFFVRSGSDILIDLPVTLPEAVLGARVTVPTPTGAVVVTVPKGSNTGAVLRLKGKGVHDHGSYGDQLVKLKVMLPTTSDASLESFLATWAPGPGYEPRRNMQS